MTRFRPSHIIFYLILLALAMVFLLPVYLLLLTSFKPFNQVDLQTMWSLPRGGLYFDNFVAGFSSWPPISPTAWSW